MAADRAVDASALIERLLLDPSLRTRFRADPAGVCAELGMAELAAELGSSSRGVETIEVRESRSSLAGVIFAAAAEGISVAHFAEQVLPHAQGHAAHVAAAAVANASRHAIAVVPSPAEAPPPAPAAPVAPSLAGLAAVPAGPAPVLSEQAQSAIAASPGLSAQLSQLAAAVPGHQLTIGSAADGRIEITAVDGQPVGPASMAARDVLQQLAALPAGSRPAAVQAPWAVDEPGFSMGARNAIAIDLAGASAATGDAAPQALAAVAAAKRMIGEPYVWGGESRKVGFDCSGLVQWAYERAGVTTLGRTTWDQAVQGTAVQWGHFQPGDLIFSNWVGGHDPEHVVMYIGDGKVVAAPHTGTDVQIQPVDVFKDHFVSARRIVHSGAGDPPAAAPAVPAAPVTAAPAAEMAGEASAGMAADPEALRAAVAVKIAQRYLGTPYLYGGESPSGFDCSGLMQYVWGKVGVHLARVSEDQIFDGTPVPRDKLQPGDLVFFRQDGDVHHVGMYVGHGRFIEAPHTGDVVKYARLDDPYYAAQYAGARRVAGMAGQDAPMPQWAVQEVEHEQGAAAAPAAPVAGPAVSGSYAAASPAPAAGTAQIGAAPAPVADAHSGGAGALDLGDPTYPGDNAPRGEIAKWMAAESKKHGLPPELPVMAALTESGLRNLNYGDRDSLGYFQMRPSVWEGEYPGFQHKPELQLKWFIHQAVAVREQRIAEGYANYGKDPASWGNWVADVERCASQYRNRYAEQLPTARKLVGD
jgi:cell wall-associated NlpC family hydrolase